MKLLLFLAAFTCAIPRIATAESGSPAEARIALVVGCDYPGTELQLPSPGKDAKGFADKLQALGFDATLLLNPNRKQLLDAIDALGQKLVDRHGVGVFYFSGHGAQEEGENYLIPCNSAVRFREDLPTEAIAAQRAVTRMENAGNRANLLFLDACRTKLLSASHKDLGPEGLAKMNAANGMLIGFATAPGTPALDGGEGSLYTNALLKNLDTPGLSVTDMLTHVNSEVRRISEGHQIPFMEVGLSDLFYFVPGANSPIPLPPAPVIPPDDARYFALVPGNEWTMDAAGTSKTGAAKGLGRYKMEGREERGGKTYTVRHDKLSVGSVHVDEMNYYRTDADGLHTIFGAAEALGEQLEVPFPIKPGNQWRVVTQFGPVDYTVVGFDTVTVPAGSYKNCCHLRSQGAMGVSDAWLAPGVGGVKSRIVSGSGSTLSQSLTAFKPAHP